MHAFSRTISIAAAWAVLAVVGGVTAARADCAAAPACTSDQRWQPQGRQNWAIDYSTDFELGHLDTSAADVFVIPLTVVDRAVTRAASEKRRNPVDVLRCTNHKKLVCYSNCGAYEPGHWDETALAPVRSQLLGKSMSGYGREKWLNIRRTDLMRDLLRRKFALAAERGCDAIVCDNMEAWITGTDGDPKARTLARYRKHGKPAVEALAASRVAKTTGFDIGYDAQLRYNRLAAEEAHASCLSIGLINDVFQIADLAADYDFALNEQCHQCGWCDLYRPFVATGKSVLNLEYRDNEGFCGPGAPSIRAICNANHLQRLSTFASMQRLASSKLDAHDRPARCTK